MSYTPVIIFTYHYLISYKALTINNICIVIKELAGIYNILKYLTSII